MPNETQSRWTPVAFEAHVKKVLDEQSAGLEDYQSKLREIVGSPDGEYEIDVTARFRALGVNFLVLIECKCWAGPVKRDHILTLEGKRQSIGAQKAMLFTTSSFQNGAKNFANVHGIALLVIEVGTSSYSIQADSCRHSRWIQIENSTTLMLQHGSRGIPWIQLSDRNRNALLDYLRGNEALLH